VWEEVFADAARPIHLEVGAGPGDWVELQAASQLEINWAAVELRSDRSNLIHAKAAMRGLTNLAVLAGDAHGVLRDGIPSRSAAAVLVNTAIAVASDPSRMAIAFRDAVTAGRTAYELGLGETIDHASPTSPLTAFLN
jgi:hypothetical protein